MLLSKALVYYTVYSHYYEDYIENRCPEPDVYKQKAKSTKCKNLLKILLDLLCYNTLKHHV